MSFNVIFYFLYSSKSIGLPVLLIGSLKANFSKLNER